MKPSSHLSVLLLTLVERRLTFIICPPGPEFLQWGEGGLCLGGRLLFIRDLYSRRGGCQGSQSPWTGWVCLEGEVQGPGIVGKERKSHQDLSVGYGAEGCGEV